MAADLKRNQRQRVFREGVVLVEQHAPFARRQLERRVRASRDVAVALAKRQFYPRIAPGELFQKRPDPGVGRGVISDAQLPAFVDLSAH